MIYTSFDAEFNRENFLQREVNHKCVVIDLDEKNVYHIPPYRNNALLSWSCQVD